jgi:hypothetical protein
MFSCAVLVNILLSLHLIKLNINKYTNMLCRQILKMLLVQKLAANYMNK